MADADAAVGSVSTDTRSPHPDSDEPEVDAAEVGEPEVDAAEIDSADEDGSEKKPKRFRRPTRAGALLVLAVVAIVAMAVVCGLLWNDVRGDRRAASDREMFLQTGRQGALNLTTIHWGEVDSNVKRILDGSTGPFHDDFAARSQSFAAVVKQAQSTSDGTITDAGLESVDGDSARVLVAATVKTSNTAAAEQQPRAWRMRVTVQKDGDHALISNVEFVP